MSNGLTTGHVDDVSLIKVENRSISNGLDSIVPGSMVQLKLDRTTFGMVIAVVGTRATVLWTHKPFSHVPDIDLNIMSVYVHAKPRKLKVGWSVDGS